MPGLAIGNPGVSKTGTVVFPASGVGWGGVSDDAEVNPDITVSVTGLGSTSALSSVTVVLPAVEPWAGYWTDAGITDPAARSAISDFYDGLATDGIQAKVPVFSITGGETATAINVMQDAYHGAFVNTPTFTQWVGARSDGATSYISTGTALSAITGISVNKTTIGVFTKQDTPAVEGQFAAMSYMAAEVSSPDYAATVIQANFQDQGGINEKFYASFPINDGWTGSDSTPIDWGDLTDVRVWLMRTGASATALYLGTAEAATGTEASVALPTVPLFICAYNSDGTPSVSADDDTFDVWGYCIAALDNSTEQALLDARVVTLRAALEAL